MNLIYQLQCTGCNVFYIGETRHSLSDHMNGHHFTFTVSPRLASCHSQTIPPDFFPRMLVFSVIHKLPDFTLTTFATYLKLHTNSSSNHVTLQDSTSVNPHIPPLSQRHLPSLVSLFNSTAEECHSVWSKSFPPFLNYVLSAGLTTRTSHLGKCHSVSPVVFIIIH